MISQFYSSELHEQVDIMKQLTNLVLAPIGGAWSDGEVLVFGEVDDLQTKGQQLFDELLGGFDNSDTIPL